LGEINALLGLVLKKHLKLPFSSIKHKEVFSTFTDENNESTDADAHTSKPGKPKHRRGEKAGVNL
jgi:hypothetical protein